MGFRTIGRFRVFERLDMKLPLDFEQTIIHQATRIVFYAKSSTLISKKVGYYKKTGF